MNWSHEAHEEFIYRIRELSSQIKYSTLVLKRTGNSTAELIGELKFARNLTLSVFENLKTQIIEMSR